MSGLDYLQATFGYNRWANDKVLAAAEALSGEDLRRPGQTSQGSVADSLIHTARTQVNWLALCQRQPWDRAPWPQETLAGIRGRLEQSDADWQAYAASLGQDELGSMRTYTEDRRGPPVEMEVGPIWHLVLHVALHGTLTRSEAAVALTALGSSPGDLDYGHFCDIRGSKSPGSLETIRALLAYNEFEDGKVLDAMARLDEPHLMQPRPGLSHHTLAMDMLHNVGAQTGWLATWQDHQEERIELPAPPGRSFYEHLRDWFARSHAAIRAFVETLPEAELGAPRVDDPSGKDRTMMLWDMMYHVVNHGTQHRAEAGLILGQLGHTPGDMDYLYFAGRAGMINRPLRGPA